MPDINAKIEHLPDNNLIELLALFTEVLGMNAENMKRQVLGQRMAFDYLAFAEMAHKMIALKELNGDDDGQ